MKKTTLSFLMMMVLSTFSWQASAQYCVSTFSSQTFEFLTNVNYAGIDNTTTGSGPNNDYTAMVASVNPGGTNTIAVTIDPDGSDYVYAFIDWNQNDVLNDAGEVYTIAANVGLSGPYTLDITVPAAAALGDTRMRVMVDWNNSIPNPCRTATFGEVEDYTVNVSNVVGNVPTIVCPATIIANNVPGTCGAVANFAGTAFDTEDGIISGDIIASPASGSTFPVGDTTVTLSVTDSDNNTSTCTFTVTVLDEELPTASCQNITVEVDPVTGVATITPADIDNGSMDNCGIASMSLDISTFDCSMIGDNTVTLTVTDDSGNIATCTSTVTVTDETAPVIACLGEPVAVTAYEDFEAATIPGGWSTNVLVGTWDWTFGSGAMPIGGDFASNAAIFDDDAAGGEDNVAELLSPVYDLSGSTTAELSFDYAVQDFIGLGLFRAEVWDGAAWQEILLVDDTDVAPVNSGIIDVSAYVNAAFQVKFTFDDELGWNWGAGVDNFLLEYEAPAAGGLDVYLDPVTGTVSVNPMDLIQSVDEACGYTVTAGGGGSTAGSITTLFDSNNNGGANWTVVYDITVGPSDIEITDLDINTSATGAFNLDLYTLVGTYVGNELNAAAWGAPAASGTGTAMGLNTPSNAVLDTPVTLSANTTYGIAISMDVAVSYSGTGTSPLPGQLNYSNADLSLTLGSGISGIFSGSVFTPRIWNGTINYNVGSGSGLEFSCADIGENLVEVTVTDASGNFSTCFATVNVIDNTAPVITCGPMPTVTTETEDFEAATIPAGWMTDVQSGTNNWAFGSGVMPIGDSFATNAAIFNDDAAGNGSVNLLSLISPVYDLTGASNVSVGYDVAFQEFGDQTFTVEVYDGASWQQIALYDASLNPNIQTESIDVSAYANAAFQVRWTYDDLGGWGWGAGVDNFELSYEVAPTSSTVVIELGPDGTATIDPYDIISSVDEACGISTAAVDVTEVSCADIGSTITVTVFVSDASGNIASCMADITVVDLLGPELTCPADQTVDPGQGNLFYVLPDYFATGEATAEDNCTDPVTITSQSPAVGTPLPDGTHTITLTAEDEYGNVSTCSFELTVESVLGVDSNSLDAGIALYPNPTTSIVNLVNSTNISLEKMMIYDINGKLVSQVDLRTMQSQKAVDVSALASGVYVVQISGDNASTVKRLIKE